MNGYGNVVPKTMLGKAATVVYAVFGIPLYVLYFRNMGKVRRRLYIIIIILIDLKGILYFGHTY